MTIETERLILRPWKESDAEDLYTYAKDPDIDPIAGWQPHKSVEDSLHIIRTVFAQPECYAVCLKTDNRAIGSIALMLNGNTELTDRDDECELEYWIGKPFWGNGYIPEAAKALIRHGFLKLRMNIIWCGYYEGNEKSKRVQEKCGFTHYKTHPHLYISLMREIRTGHITRLTRAEWLTRKQI